MNKVRIPVLPPKFLQKALVQIEQRFTPQIHLQSHIPSHELPWHSQLIKNTTQYNITQHNVMQLETEHSALHYPPCINMNIA